MVKCECCDGRPQNRDDSGEPGKDVRVSFCPKCKSVKVRYVFGFGNLFGLIPKMRCGDCGFEMASFPVLVTTEKKLRESVANLKSKVESTLTDSRQKLVGAGSRKSKVKTGATKKRVVSKIKKKVVGK